MCQKCSVIFLVLINIVFFLAGAVMVSLGIIAFVKEDLLYEVTDFIIGSLSEIISDIEIVSQIDLAGLIKTNAVILLVIGSVLFVLGFLGVCGAKQKSASLLTVYAVIVLVITAAEVGLAVYAYMYTDQFEAKLQTGLKLGLYKTYENGYRELNKPGYLNSSSSAPEISMDMLQIRLECCGVVNGTEWAYEADNWNKTYSIKFSTVETFNAIYPPSCCMLSNKSTVEIAHLAIPVNHFTNLEQCMKGGTVGRHETPCYDRIRGLVLENQAIIVVIFVCIVAAEILAVICACYLKDAKK